MSHHIFLVLCGLASAPLARAQLTAGPPPHLVMAAINAAAIGEGSLEACSVADEHLFSCADRIQGQLTDLDDLLPCACCTTRQPIGDVYGQCANYISESLTRLSSSYSLFSGMDYFCSQEPSNFCRTAAVDDDISASGGSLPTDVVASLTTASGFASATAPAGGSDDGQDSCQSLGLTVLECAEATPELLNAPVISLAGCFCYSTDARGSSTYAGDEIAGWASTCADWARSARDTSALTIATPFTNMCQSYTATALDGPPSPIFTDTNGDDDGDDGDNETTEEPQTVTVTQVSTPSGEATEDDDSSGTALRVSVAAGVVAVLAAVAFS